MFKLVCGFRSFDILFQLAPNRCRLFGVEIGALSSHNELLYYAVRCHSSKAICLLIPPLLSLFSRRTVHLLFHVFPLKLPFPFPGSFLSFSGKFIKAALHTDPLSVTTLNNATLIMHLEIMFSLLQY